MNLGRLNKAELVKAARKRGLSEAQLEELLRKNATLVARHGATFSTGK